MGMQIGEVARLRVCIVHCSFYQHENRFDSSQALCLLKPLLSTTTSDSYLELVVLVTILVIIVGL